MMRLILDVWRQKTRLDVGRFVRYEAREVTAEMSLLELLDVVNEGLVLRGDEPIAFDNDCREGICGSCGFLVNGLAHGPQDGAAACQVYLRRFKSGQTLRLEPFRAAAFPIIKDLVVDRSALDRIIMAGGYVSINAGSAPEANTTAVRKVDTDSALDAATCIGCGACVAACPNASAALFTGAKLTHLGSLPQGQPERSRRVLHMVEVARDEGFGHCTTAGECEAVCPKRIPLRVIARMNRDWLRASMAAENRAPDAVRAKSRLRKKTDK